MAEEQVFETFTEEELEILSEHVSTTTGDVFTVKLPPGMAGPTFARYSRAPGGWRRTFLKEFVKEGQINTKKADSLIARVLISFGDDSVGELEGAHLSVENISNLATKAFEDARIGVAYIEQSSRFVEYDQRDTEGRYRYLQDPKKNPIMESKHGPAFVKGMDRVFGVYCDLVKRLKVHLETVKPRDEAEYKIGPKGKMMKRSDLTAEKDVKAFDRTHDSTIKGKACDISRILLPAATLTNVGAFCNGRAYQNILTRLYSSEMPELHVLAEQSHEALNHVMKRFVERAKRDEFIAGTNRNMQELTDNLFKGIKPASEDQVVLLDTGIERIAEKVAEAAGKGRTDFKTMIPEMYQREFQTNMIAYMFYKYAEHPMRQIRDVVRALPEEARQLVINTYVGEREHRRQKSGRALEGGYDLSFDLIGDFGIFRDLHRQRMLTMERQRLSTRHGFVELHPMLEVIGAKSEVEECRDISADLYEKIRADQGRDIAQYPVLFGHNIRFTQGFNDRQGQFYLELRTGKQGHPSYREVCQKMHNLIRERAPWRADMMKHVDHKDYFWSRAESEAGQRRKEAKLGLKPEGGE